MSRLPVAMDSTRTRMALAIALDQCRLSGMDLTTVVTLHRWYFLYYYCTVLYCTLLYHSQHSLHG